MIFGNPWTVAEDAVLRADYLKRGAQAIATELGRSFSAVAHRANRLGLASHRRWTPVDDQTIRDLWGHSSLARLSQELKRTKLTIYYRARMLDLECGAPEGFEYLSDAAKRCGYSVATLRRILSAHGVTLKITISRPGKSKRHYHMVDVVDVDEAVEAWLASEDIEPAAEARSISGECLKRWLIDARSVGFDVPSVPKAAKARWRVPSKTIDAVVAWRGKHESVSEAARRHGMSRYAMNALLVRSGVARFTVKPWLVERSVVDELVAQRRAA